MNTEILYPIALDADGSFVHAVDAPRGSYTCLECHNSMNLRKGRVKRPHYAHKALSPNCTPKSALHSAAKVLLHQRISEFLVRGQTLPIKWRCRCGDDHSGNLLKKATEVRIEPSLGSVRPDIGLFEGDRCLAVVEVVVTHPPEDSSLSYYAQNEIAVLTIHLKTDLCLSKVTSAPELIFDFGSVCAYGPCLSCGRLRKPRFVDIHKTKCWKCDSEMRIAFPQWAQNDGERLGSLSCPEWPERYKLLDKLIARKRGVRIVRRKTRFSSFESCQCPKCGVWDGHHYVDSYHHDFACSEPIEVVRAGWVCLADCDWNCLNYPDGSQGWGDRPSPPANQKRAADALG